MDPPEKDASVKRIEGPLLAAFAALLFVLAAEALWRMFPAAIPRSVEHLARARVYRYDPGVGVVLRPGVDRALTIPWLERVVRVRTTGHGRPVGFRDDGFQGGPRVAILGDSYTFGYGVDQGESFPEQLERRLRARGIAIDVINGGVPGFGAREQRRMLEKHVLPLKPALVLVAVYGNDLGDNVRSAHARWLGIREFLGVHSILYQIASAARAAHPRIDARVAGKSPSESRSERPAQRSAERPSAEGYAIERRELARMRNLCAARGVRFGLILLPDTPPLEEGRLRPEGAAVPILDLEPRFAGLPRDAWRNPYVGHLTPEANGWVAEAIAEFMSRNSLIDTGSGPGPA